MQLGSIINPINKSLMIKIYVRKKFLSFQFSSFSLLLNIFIEFAVTVTTDKLFQLPTILNENV